MWCQYKVHGAKSGREAAIEAALRSEGGGGCAPRTICERRRKRVEREYFIQYTLAQVKEQQQKKKRKT